MIEKPRYWMAIIVTVLVMVALSVLVFQSGVIKDESLSMMESREVPQAQIDAAAKILDSPIIVAISLVSFVLGLAISAGLLLFMGNLLMGAKLRFSHYLSAVAYGGLVGAVDHVIRAVLVVTRRSIDVRLGLGNLFGDELNYPLRVLDLATNPLLLWGMAVMALGVAAYSRKGFGFGVVASLPVFLATVLITARQ